MIRKTLLLTTVLMVAGSMALATSRTVVHRPMGAADSKTIAEKRALKLLVPKGAMPLLNKRGVPAGFIYNNPGKVAPRDNVEYPGATFNSFSKSRNARFLSFYGWAAQNENITNRSTSSSSSCYSSSNGHCVNWIVSTYSQNTTGTHSTAAPISGAGKTVSNIALGGYHFNGYGGNGKAAIYSNHSGTPCSPYASSSSSSYTTTCPAGPIAGASGTFTVPSSTLCCSIATAAITPTALSSGTKYWVVVTGETGTPPYNNYLAWDMEDRDYKTQPNPFVYRWQYTYKYKTTYATTRYGGTKYHTTRHGTGYNSSQGWLQAGGFYGNGQFPADAPGVAVY